MTLHVVREGLPDAPELVVLVHGSMDRSAGFAKVARRLTDAVAVWRYDRRGYGQSVDHDGPFGVADHVDDLCALVAGEARSGRRVVLIGHSFGGNVALGAAARLGDAVAGVAAFEPPMSWQPWWPAHSAGGDAVASGEDPAAAAEGFMKRMVGEQRWLRLPAATREARRAEGRVLVAELTDLRRRAPWDAADITAAVVMGRSSNAREHHRQGALEAARLIPGVRSEIIDGAAHNAHYTHPDEFVAQIVEPLLSTPRG